MFSGVRGRFAHWRERFREPVDPFAESTFSWARRRTTLTITSAGFILAEIIATPLVGFLVSAAAGALTALALVVLTYLGSLVVAPVSQRNTLRSEVRGRPGDLVFMEQLEHVRWEYQLPVGPRGRIMDIHVRAVAWLWVTNNGPTASFAAEVREVTGVPSDWGDYFVAEAEWDQKNSAVIEIPHGGRRKLKLLAIVLHPQRGFWFWTSEGQVEAPGWQAYLGDGEDADLRFEVVLTNTASDQVNACRGRVKIPGQVRDSTFELVTS
jgi:hypothetical protein